MTDIPGTGKLKSEVQIPNAEKPLPLTVLNVNEIVNPESARPENEIWYNQFLTWILGGSILSIILAFLAFVYDKTFLVLTPLGPILGILTWYVRKLAAKVEKKQDILFKRD